MNVIHLPGAPSNEPPPQANAEQPVDEGGDNNGTSNLLRDAFVSGIHFAYRAMSQGGPSGPAVPMTPRQQLEYAAVECVVKHVVSGCEMAVCAGVGRMADAYRWMYPLRPEDILRRGLFTRRDIDRMLTEAIRDNAIVLMLQPHRVSPAMRRHIEDSGFRVEDTVFEDMPSVKIHLLPQAALPAPN